ncbi:hypothetical protein LNKW23_19180 [Paralimibaculum aggregatum]|uniref:Inner membrane protein n=1 Tax=Paralimibaculum aggregatum TaxID=3036245 RepID=A0ABQ6LQB7_9RHOB|nr:hypothetical protein [Limibaculum sp. NKW23]GMG82705.1 hypothetical protein LNKW23_19180 [Limibaculum sp. NKW23]
MTARSLTGDPDHLDPAGYDPAEEVYDAYDDEPHAPSLAATLLWLLIGAVFVAAVTLWAAPKLAPHLPAPVARFLTPVPEELRSRMAALEAQAAARQATLEAEVEALRAAAASAVMGEEAATAFAGLTGQMERLEAAQKAATATSEAARAEARVALAQAETAERIARGAEQGVRAASASAAAAEDAAAELSLGLAQLKAGLERLAAARAADPAFLPRAEAEALAPRDELAALSGEIAALRARIGQQLHALGARLDASERQAERIQTSALGEAEAALRNAALRGAADALATRVLAGESYATVLAEVEALIGRPAPPALAAHAAAGIAQPASLAGSLPGAARAAIAAEARIAGDDGPTDRVGSWLQRQIFVMPKEEQAGPSLTARISRIEARLREGELAAALAEAEALPPAAAAAMAGWTAALADRVAAERALAEYVAPALIGAP